MYTISQQVFYITRGTQPSNGRVPILTRRYFAVSFQGCYVTGLYLEGGHWDLDTSCLAPPLPRVLTEPLPVMAVIPTPAHRLSLQNCLRTPLYVTSQRRNAMGVGLVGEAFLNIGSTHPSHWILRGLCLTLNSD